MVDTSGQSWIIDFGLAAHLDQGNGKKPPNATGPSDELATAIRDSLKSFTEGSAQSDDITLIVARRVPA